MLMSQKSLNDKHDTNLLTEESSKQEPLVPSETFYPQDTRALLVKNRNTSIFSSIENCEKVIKMK